MSHHEGNSAATREAIASACRAQIDEMIAALTAEVKHAEHEAAEIVRVRATPFYAERQSDESDRRGAKEWQRHKRDAEFVRLILADLEKRKAAL